LDPDSESGTGSRKPERFTKKRKLSLKELYGLLLKLKLSSRRPYLIYFSILVMFSINESSIQILSRIRIH
jgi:hypothetical protein